MVKMKKIIGVFVVGIFCLILGLSVLWGRSEGLSLINCI